MLALRLQGKTLAPQSRDVQEEALFFPVLLLPDPPGDDRDKLASNRLGLREWRSDRRRPGVVAVAVAVAAPAPEPGLGIVAAVESAMGAGDEDTPRCCAVETEAAPPEMGCVTVLEVVPDPSVELEGGLVGVETGVR